MNRRNFLSTMIGGVAVSAAVRTWPFRVYSFPADIVIPAVDIAVADGDLYGTIQVLSVAEFVKKYPRTAKDFEMHNINPNDYEFFLAT